MPTNQKKYPTTVTSKKRNSDFLNSDLSGYQALMREREKLDEKIANFAAMRNKAIDAVRLACEKYELTELEVFGNKPKAPSLTKPMGVTKKKTPSSASPVKNSTARAPVAPKTKSADTKKTPATKKIRPAAAQKPLTKKSAIKAVTPSQDSSGPIESVSETRLTLEKRTSGAKPSNNKGIANANPLPFTVPK